jgi:hypothetical protein
MPNEKPAVADDEARKDRQWERHKKACENRRRVIDREHYVFVRVGMVPLMAAVEEQPMQQGAMHPIFNKREQQRAAGRRTNPPQRSAIGCDDCSRQQRVQNEVEPVEPHRFRKSAAMKRKRSRFAKRMIDPLNLVGLTCGMPRSAPTRICRVVKARLELAPALARAPMARTSAPAGWPRAALPGSPA